MSTTDFSARFQALQHEYLEHMVAHYGGKMNSPRDGLTLHQHAMGGAIKIADAVALAEILTYLKPKKILEIGSFIGFSTRWILDIAAPWGATLTSIDPNINHRWFDNPRGHLKSFCAKHEAHLTSVDAFASFKPKFFKDSPIPVIDEPFDIFDFAFIDGDHEFKSVLKNTALVASMMPKGGIIVGHDPLSWEDVIPATEAYASLSPQLDYHVIKKCDARLAIASTSVSFSLSSPISSFRQWNHNRIQKRRGGVTDGLTMFHIPKDCHPHPPRVKTKVKDTFQKTIRELKNEFLKNRKALLKKRLLKIKITDKLNTWGY